MKKSAGGLGSGSKQPTTSVSGTRPKQTGPPGAKSKQLQKPGASSKLQGKPQNSGVSSSVMSKLENAQLPIKKVDGMYVPEGYKMRVIKPAKNYDVVSMAKAMNDDFAPKLKELFDTETSAAIEAQKTGIYIGWRCPDFKHDCQRIFHISRCFCDHSLGEHAQYHVMSVKVPCRVPGCKCQAYNWIPNRPEDIGEFWLAKRPGFDPEAWRAKCKCKHTHNFHAANRPHRCSVKGCPCGGFMSDFLCAACDRHWEEHQTFFDSEQSRREQGLPTGTDWLPFAEMPDLRNIALSGDEADDRHYLALKQFDRMPENAITGNNMAFNPPDARGGGRAGPSSSFKPTYD